MKVYELIEELNELVTHFGRHIEVVLLPRPLSLTQTLAEREVDRPIQEARYEQGKVIIR